MVDLTHQFIDLLLCSRALLHLWGGIHRSENLVLLLKFSDPGLKNLYFTMTFTRYRLQSGDRGLVFRMFPKQPLCPVTCAVYTFDQPFHSLEQKTVMVRGQI